MSKITATKEVTFALAHMLAGHQGLCANLHGHEYLLEVELTRRDGDVEQDNTPAQGMVVDFKEIKEIVQHTILDRFDHATAIWRKTTDPFEQQLRDLLLTHNKKVCILPFRPTAESMVPYMAMMIQAQLDEHYPSVVVSSATLWETRTSKATWTR